ncbi:hypothetical protein FQA39_LY03249 [Lamprigera yunnana]|nr:hypothetical protein FQA39_LY03249 [Lamprigera yunnana]
MDPFQNMKHRDLSETIMQNLESFKPLPAKEVVVGLETQKLKLEDLLDDDELDVLLLHPESPSEQIEELQQDQDKATEAKFILNMDLPKDLMIPTYFKDHTIYDLQSRLEVSHRKPPISFETHWTGICNKRSHSSLKPADTNRTVITPLELRFQKPNISL